MKTIFIVDDSDVNLSTAAKALEKQYRVFTLTSASDMFDLLNNIAPDLILLDIMMPGMNGFEALQLLRSDARYSDIPVMLISSRNDAATEAQAFEIGALDFISKPFYKQVLLNRIKTHLGIEELIHERTANLARQTDKLKKLQNSIVFVLADMVESRDKQTGSHVERTTNYVEILLKAMLERGVYSDEISRWNLDEVALSARLHDIGKIAVTDLVLNKPGLLTKEEYELMKTHAYEGEKIIDNIIAKSGDDNFLLDAKLFAGYHHERWDGSGYPRGLKGRDILLQGRVMALADVYDALISDRPYKKAFSHEKALEIIKESANSHFDPAIVDVFLENSGLFEKV